MLFSNPTGDMHPCPPGSLLRENQQHYYCACKMTHCYFVKQNFSDFAISTSYCLWSIIHRPLDCIFLQLYLKPVVHISFYKSLLQVFLGRPLSLWPCDVHCNACLSTLSSDLLSVCPSHLHFLLHSCCCTSFSPVFFHSSLFDILSAASVRLLSFCGHLLMKVVGSRSRSREKEALVGRRMTTLV